MRSETEFVRLISNVTVDSCLCHFKYSIQDSLSQNIGVSISTVFIYTYI